MLSFRSLLLYKCYAKLSVNSKSGLYIDIDFRHRQRSDLPAGLISAACARFPRAAGSLLVASSCVVFLRPADPAGVSHLPLPINLCIKSKLGLYKDIDSVLIFLPIIFIPNTRFPLAVEDHIVACFCGIPLIACLTCRSLLSSTLINVESKRALGATRYALRYSSCLFFSAQIKLMKETPCYY
jgi:hypothetical protein